MKRSGYCSLVLLLLLMSFNKRSNGLPEDHPTLAIGAKAPGFKLVAVDGKTYTLANFSTSNFMVDRILEKNVFYRTNFVTIHQDMFRISQFHVLWPVPQSAISANPDGRINQNIGYSGADLNVPALDVIPE